MREPIDSFTIDWEGSFADFAQAKLQRPDVPKADGFVKSLFDWVDGKRAIGAEFEELYKSELEITGDWRFERPLGRGAFGVVALFKHYRFDEIVDEVVVKDVFRKDHDHHDSKRSLSREATVMAQTNELNNESIIRLRNYKYLEDARQYRYFFDNCEYGDLELLRLKYKAWQQHVPELFLWHLFSCFSSGHSAMTSGPFRSMQRRSFGKVHNEGYLIHCDIKPHNVFLRPPTKAKRVTRLYPSPKIADFGLATILSGPEDPNNRAINMLNGTRRWMAPEIRVDQMGCSWQFSATPNLHADRSAHVIRTETNLFPLAAIIWTFMTGREIDDLDRMIYDNIKHQTPPKSPYVDPDLRPSGRSPVDYYSSELRALVRDCLKTLPSLRPTTVDLQERIRNGMKRCIAREEARNQRNPNATASQQKIYCEANEINAVPQGKADFKLDKLFWQRFASETLFVPEEWGALLPPTAPQDWQPSRKWSPELKERWMDNLNRARIDKRRRDGGPEEVGPVSKRAKVKEALRNIKNNVPSLRRATTTARPTFHQQRPVQPSQLAGRAPYIPSPAFNTVKDKNPKESQRPAHGPFVSPPDTQHHQPVTASHKRAFNDSTIAFTRQHRNLRPRSYTAPQPQPQAQTPDLQQPFESANAWADRWLTSPDDNVAVANVDAAMPPPTTMRPQRRAHVRRNRAPSGLDRNGRG